MADGDESFLSQLRTLCREKLYPSMRKAGDELAVAAKQVFKRGKEKAADVESSSAAGIKESIHSLGEKGEKLAKKSAQKLQKLSAKYDEPLTDLKEAASDVWGAVKGKASKLSNGQKKATKKRATSDKPCCPSEEVEEEELVEDTFPDQPSEDEPQK